MMFWLYLYLSRGSILQIAKQKAQLILSNLTEPQSLKHKNIREIAFCMNQGHADNKLVERQKKMGSQKSLNSYPVGTPAMETFDEFRVFPRLHR